MDYEKKYNEALEKAKKATRAGGDVALDIVQYIFPELRESEDERIRKAIIDLINATGVVNLNYSHKQMIAWLEKQKEPENVSATTMAPSCWAEEPSLQKEQEPIDPSDDELQRHQDELYDFKVFAARQAREHHISFVHDFEWDAFCGEILSYFNEQKPKLVQHPPISYTYPSDASRDEQLKMALLALLNSDLIKVAGNKFTKQDLIDWVEKRQVQKPAEWSEEDEKIVNNIVSVLGQYIDYKAVSGTGSGYATPRYSKEMDWLKSLRPQSQGIYKQVIHTIFGMLKDKDFYGMPSSSCVSLLNDIRVKCKDAIDCAPILDEPHWKPSEEQMNALNAINCHGELSYVGQQNQLISLQNDLEKLMKI